MGTTKTEPITDEELQELRYLWEANDKQAYFPKGYVHTLHAFLPAVLLRLERAESDLTALRSAVYEALVDSGPLNDARYIGDWYVPHTELLTLDALLDGTPYEVGQKEGKQ
jgi:hypothetical protein